MYVMVSLVVFRLHAIFPDLFGKNKITKYSLGTMTILYVRVKYLFKITFSDICIMYMLYSFFDR